MGDSRAIAILLATFNGAKYLPLQLESLAAQICAVQRTLEPVLLHPIAVVFAADHGAADRGVSA